MKKTGSTSRIQILPWSTRSNMKATIGEMELAVEPIVYSNTPIALSCQFLRSSRHFPRDPFLCHPESKFFLINFVSHLCDLKSTGMNRKIPRDVIEYWGFLLRRTILSFWFVFWMQGSIVQIQSSTPGFLENIRGFTMERCVVILFSAELFGAFFVLLL